MGRRTAGRRRVVMVAFEDFQILDLTGPAEVFAVANRLLPAGDRYRVQVLSPDGAGLRASSGIVLSADGGLEAGRGPIDTLVVVGGEGTRQALSDERLVGWIRTAAARSRRTTSVCTGAFLLARAGLLDGRRATTHWSQCDTLAAAFPAVTVDPDPIFVRDGDVWTSAGVTAGMDLALRLVEDDHGPALAREVARWLVLFVQRPGGQAQFSTQLAAQRPGRSTLRDLEAWIPDHLAEDLRVPALATRCAMSPRHFARTFRAELGVPPAAYVEGVRLEAARRLLETTDRSLPAVAAACGFGTVETLHRSVKRALGVTPGQYRAHFSAQASA